MPIALRWSLSTITHSVYHPSQALQKSYANSTKLVWQSTYASDWVALSRIHQPREDSDTTDLQVDYLSVHPGALLLPFAIEPDSQARPLFAAIASLSYTDTAMSTGVQGTALGATKA